MDGQFQNSDPHHSMIEFPNPLFWWKRTAWSFKVPRASPSLHATRGPRHQMDALLNRAGALLGGWLVWGG